MASPMVEASALAVIGRARVREWLSPSHAEPIGRLVAHWVCGLQGHERYLHTDRDRVSLRCVACGHESPGWSTGRPAYQRTWPGDAARHRLR